MSGGEKIIYLEAGDHMITDEAKRHKLALMLACSFVLMISYYHDATVGSLFGIIKFAEGNEIGVLELIPFAIAVMLYHAIIYAYHFNEARKAWINKKLKAVREQRISKFNMHAESIDNGKLEIIDKTLPTIQSNRFNKSWQLDSLIRAIDSNIGKESLSEDFTATVLEIDELMYKVRGISISSKSSSDQDQLKELNQQLYTLCDKLYKNLGKEKFVTTKLELIKQCYAILEKVSSDFDNAYISKYNYYLEEDFKRKQEFKQVILESLSQREAILDEMRSFKFDERSASLLYAFLPFIYFSSALIFGVTTYLVNMPNYVC